MNKIINLSTLLGSVCVGAFVAAGVAAAEHEADPKRVVERDPRQLESRGRDDCLIAGRQRAAESRIRVAIARHANVCSPMGRPKATPCIALCEEG